MTRDHYCAATSGEASEAFIDVDDVVVVDDVVDVLSCCCCSFLLLLLLLLLLLVETKTGNPLKL